MTTRCRISGTTRNTRGATPASAALLVSLVILGVALLASPAAASIASEPGVKSPSAKSDTKCL